MSVELDCKYFKGDEPCRYYKQEKLKCRCKYYAPVKTKILIIKLAEIGDVIRTTPILARLKKEYPDSEITWITRTPEVLPNLVDNRLRFNQENLLQLRMQKFDLLLNFDKEKESCALANLIDSKLKKGFHLREGKCYPLDKDAEFKYELGIDDDFNLKNKKSYPEQIFEIAGYKFNKEKYVFDNSYFKGKKLIGLNTGCSEKWKTRLWPKKNWISLARALIEKGYSVILLGGKSEHEDNKIIAEASHALYLGYHPLKTFIALVNFCDVIVTAVTMMLHLAIALERKIVLFNNAFNKEEFELYGLGRIIEPDVDCIGCFKHECDKVPFCMEKITVDEVMKNIEEVLKE